MSKVNEFDKQTKADREIEFSNNWEYITPLSYFLGEEKGSKRKGGHTAPPQKEGYFLSKTSFLW